METNSELRKQNWIITEGQNKNLLYIEDLKDGYLFFINKKHKEVAELVAIAPRLLDLAYSLYVSDHVDYTELRMMAKNIISDIDFLKIK